jgi:hypothetical protein
VFFEVIWLCNIQIQHEWPLLRSFGRFQSFFFRSEVSSLDRYTALLLSVLFSLCFSFHTSVPTFCRGRHQLILSIAPERISYYLLGGGLRRSKLGLDLDLVATKHWLASSDRAASGTFTLKTFCQANSKLLSFPR